MFKMSTRKLRGEKMKLRKDIKRGNISPQLEKIKHLREAKNITQEEMANYLGIHKDTYIKKENGVCRIYINELFKIMIILGCEVEDIF